MYQRQYLVVGLVYTAIFVGLYGLEIFNVPSPRGLTVHISCLIYLFQVGKKSVSFYLQIPYSPNNCGRLQLLVSVWSFFLLRLIIVLNNTIKIFFTHDGYGTSFMLCVLFMFTVCICLFRFISNRLDWLRCSLLFYIYSLLEMVWDSCYGDRTPGGVIRKNK